MGNGVGMTETTKIASSRRRAKNRPESFGLKLNGKIAVGVSFTAEEARELRQVLRLKRVSAHALAHNPYRPGKRGIEVNMERAGVKITGNHRAKRIA